MTKNKKFTFIDLFAGIGGFHIALDNLGGECVFASEMDIHARKTYEHNFKKTSPSLFENEMFNDDIRNIAPSDIPDFDVLCAGFPCQPFSQAGHKRGFDDNHNSERGNLFFNIVDILEEKKPKAFFLENVRGLLKHDDGNTFQVIRTILEKELGYSFYFKIVKASDYGLPQLRPRIFMIGFRDEGFLKGFSFPPSKPLKFTMSDVWEGECSRKIGYTLRVGGRGSNITDRRNWDAYLVDGQVKQLGVLQGKKMQGFPDSYEFPVSKTQAIKQLGNSVAIDAIQEVAKQMVNHFKSLNLKSEKMKETKNKGEWTELLVFVKLLTAQKIHLSDKELNPKEAFFNIKKVTTRNLDLEFYIIDKTTIQLKYKNSEETKNIKVADILNEEIFNDLITNITNQKTRAFTVPSFDGIREKLAFKTIKGGNSNQKADIVLNIQNEEIQKNDEGFGIKSHLGSKATILNASGNTNFIFEVKGIDSSKIDEINGINTRTKLKDRIQFIENSGGSLNYIGAETSTMEYNLKMSDSLMPNIVGELLLSFYSKRISKISDIVEKIHKTGKLNSEINYGDKQSLKSKLKKLLIDALLGFFAGKKWDGEYGANGTIVMKKTGNMVGFHIIEAKVLKEYLYENIRLETPSSSRHRFGKIYKEKNGKLYFKLNFQLRF